MYRDENFLHHPLIPIFPQPVLVSSQIAIAMQIIPIQATNQEKNSKNKLLLEYSKIVLVLKNIPEPMVLLIEIKTVLKKPTFPLEDSDAIDLVLLNFEFCIDLL